MIPVYFSLRFLRVKVKHDYSVLGYCVKKKKNVCKSRPRDNIYASLLTFRFRIPTDTHDVEIRRRTVAVYGPH